MKNKILNITLPLVILLSGCATTANAENEESDSETIVVDTSKEETTIKESSMDVDKQETVIAKSKGDGTVYETTVEVSLKHGDDSSVEDVSCLTDIKNTLGDEEYNQDGDNITFENKGSDIQYKGSTNKELPIQLTPTYKLDGQDISYEKLKDVSGNIEIKYTFSNQEKFEETYVPFVTLTIFNLDSDMCSNITIDNGKIINQDDMLLAIGYTTPSLKDDFNFDGELIDDVNFNESFTLKFKASNYTLDSSSTIITNGLFKDVDETDIQDLINIENDLSDFNEAGTKLSDGLSQYNNSMNEFTGYSSQILNGIKSLSDGTSTLDDSLQQINNNMSSLVDGANGLSDGLSSLETELNQIDLSNATDLSTASETTITELSTIITTINNKVEEVNDAIEKVNSLSDQLNELQNAIDNNQSLSSEEKEELKNKIPSVDIQNIDKLNQDSLNNLQSSVQTMISSLTNLSGLISSISTLKETISQLSNGSLQLSGGTKTMASYISQISQGSSQLKNGANQLNESYIQINDGVNSLSQASGTILEGFNTYKKEGVDELVEQMNNISILGKDLENIKKADESYKSFTGLKDGKTCSTLFLLETDSLSD